MTSTALEMTAVAEQKLTQAELDRARMYLDQTKVGITGAIKALSDPQWNFKPSPGQWSVGEITEHVIDVLGLVLGPVRGKLDQAASTPAHPDYKQVDDIIVYRFPNRLAKFPSPVQPAGCLSPSQAIERLTADYARLSDYLETSPDLRNRYAEAPPLKAVSNGTYESMDGYQWILAAAAHTERHTKQILEVMADPAFPS